MEHAAKSSSKQRREGRGGQHVVSSRAAASLVASKRASATQREAAGSFSDSPRVIAQQPSSSVALSPRVIAQRGQFEGMFGNAFQRGAASIGSVVQRYRGNRNQVFARWQFHRCEEFPNQVVAAAQGLSAAYFAHGADTDAVTQQFVSSATQQLVAFAEANLDEGLEKDQVIDTITVEMQTIGDGWFLKKLQELRRQATTALATIRGAVHAALDSTDAPTRNVMQ
jgi:hypothetical protein